MGLILFQGQSIIVIQKVFNVRKTAMKCVNIVLDLLHWQLSTRRILGQYGEFTPLVVI
jgi:hypothetical protein